MRRTIIAAEHLTFPSTFSSNPPRFAGRARLARKRGQVERAGIVLAVDAWLHDHHSLKPQAQRDR
ncbi:MAG: hypothetical protein WBE29_06375, partial [Pseudolabrys sp.]